MPIPKDNSPTLRCFLYAGFPWSHNAFVLRAADGNERFYSFNADTKEENQRLNDDRDYTPKNELPLLDEEDPSTLVYRFGKRQVGPMYSHGARVEHDYKVFGEDFPPKEVNIPLSEHQFDRAKRWLDKQEDAINQGRVRYSIFNRQQAGVTHHSCASFTDGVLNQVAESKEKSLVAPSLAESMTALFPTGVQKRAASLAEARGAAVVEPAKTMCQEQADSTANLLASVLNPFN